MSMWHCNLCFQDRKFRYCPKGRTVSYEEWLEERAELHSDKVDDYFTDPLTRRLFFFRNQLLCFQKLLPSVIFPTIISNKKALCSCPCFDFKDERPSSTNIKFKFNSRTSLAHLLYHRHMQYLSGVYKTDTTLYMMNPLHPTIATIDSGLTENPMPMEWSDAPDQILCGDTEVLHASTPSWLTVTGTTPASLKCQASTIAPWFSRFYPELANKVRPSFTQFLEDSGVWWEPGSAMQFNAKTWLEFQPFLRDYKANSARITDVGRQRFRKLKNLALAAVSRCKDIQFNHHSPMISIMTTPREAVELLAIFPQADDVVAQALWGVPFGCDYLLQILKHLIGIIAQDSTGPFAIQNSYALVRGNHVNHDEVEEHVFQKRYDQGCSMDWSDLAD